MVKRITGILVLVFLTAALGLAGCGSPTTATLPAATPSPEGATAQVGIPSSPGVIAAYEGTLQEIYTRVNPSVVHIRVGQREELPASSTPQPPLFPYPYPTPEGPEFYQWGQGSGFVWDQEGHIVTNNHVIEGADTITVTFYDGTIVDATLVGADPDTDLAVVKVDVSDERLRPVQMADSAQVRVGQLAVAIGNPFGLKGTMTVGIVSSLGRVLPAGSQNEAGLQFSIPDIVQTDAPINPGNSGGVLLNAAGQVIGVTSAIRSPVEASVGIGFAISAAIVQQVVPVLVETGRYLHPWLGVTVLSLEPLIAESMGLDRNQRGALVIAVSPGSPADQAGVRGSDETVTIEGEQLRIGGDAITAIEGQLVKDTADLIVYLTRYTVVGQTVSLIVLRDGEEMALTATLAPRPAAGE